MNYYWIAPKTVDQVAIEANEFVTARMTEQIAALMCLSSLLMEGSEAGPALPADWMDYWD